MYTYEWEETILSTIIKRLTNSYIDDALVRLAYNSSAIEGNTITLPETATIIINQTLPNNSKITNREYFEVLNHQPAFEYMITNIQNNNPLSVSIIKEIHEILTDRLQHDKGMFKIYPNYISGTEFNTALPENVPGLMNQLVDNLSYRIEQATSDEEVIKAILEAHISFEKIHPFSDGNGRTGRLIMTYSLLENNLPPLIIKKKDKNSYQNILHNAQIKDFPSDDDIQQFYTFALPLLLEEKKRINSFFHQQQQQIEL